MDRRRRRRRLGVLDLALRMDFGVMSRRGLLLATVVGVLVKQGLLALMRRHAIGLRHRKHQGHVSSLFF